MIAFPDLDGADFEDSGGGKDREEGGSEKRRDDSSGAGDPRDGSSRAEDPEDLENREDPRDNSPGAEVGGGGSCAVRAPEENGKPFRGDTNEKNSGASISDAPSLPAVLEAGLADPEGLDDEALGDAIATLAAHITAATYRFLTLLRVFDEREARGWGFRSTAHWLSWRTGMSLHAARERVRVARALGELPRISEAMARGELSFSKARALTRVATPAMEADLVEMARHAPASHLDRLVRAWRRVDREVEVGLEQARHEARHFSLYTDEDGTWVVRGRLDPEVGALLRKALESASEELYRKTKEGEAAEARERREERRRTEDSPWGPRGRPRPGPTYGQRLADAVGLVAEQALEAAGGGDSAVGENPIRRGRADRFQVVVHVDESVLREEAEKVSVTSTSGSTSGSGSGSTSGSGSGSTSGSASDARADSHGHADLAPEAEAGDSEAGDLPGRGPAAPAAPDPLQPTSSGQAESKGDGPTQGPSTATPAPAPGVPATSSSSNPIPASRGGQSVLEESGHHVPAGTSRRLACDAGVVRMRHNARGEVLDVGRRTRTVPPAIRRALEVRDRTCRFPGCGCRYTDAHHIIHWAEGGETKLDNLVLLCRRHHRAVHEEGWRVEVVVDGKEVRDEAGRPEDEEAKGGSEGPGPAGTVEEGDRGGGVGGGLDVRFYRPDGRLVPAVPPAPGLVGDATEVLLKKQVAEGIEPDEWTATPHWHGEALDLDWAVQAMLGLRKRREEEEEEEGVKERKAGEEKKIDEEEERREMGAKKEAMGDEGSRPVDGGRCMSERGWARPTKTGSEDRRTPKSRGR